MVSATLDKDVQKVVEIATLGSICILAAGALHGVDAQVAAAHPEISKAFLFAGLLFILGAAVMLAMCIFGNKDIPKVPRLFFLWSSVLGCICFLVGAILAVWYFIF